MKPSLVALLSVLSVACAADLPSGDARPAADRRAFADGLFARGLYKQAAREYTRLAAEFPDGPEADLEAFRLGESLRLSGDLYGAQRAYSKVIDRQPVSPWREKARFKKASIFSELGQPDAAEELFRLLLADNPSPEVREMALYYHAGALEALKRTEDAIREFEDLLREAPAGRMADYARLSLGRLLAAPAADGGAPRDAARAHKILSDLAAGSSPVRLRAEALFLLGSNAYAERRYADAAAFFSRLREKAPEDFRVAESRLPCAWAFLHDGRDTDALAVADAALAASPAPTPAVALEFRFVRAQALFRLARNEEALAAYKTIYSDPAAATSPFATHARLQAALTLYKLQRWDEAIVLARILLEDKASRCNGLWLLAQAAAASGTVSGIDTAIESYRRFTTEFPTDERAPDALYRLGYLLRGRKAWNDADRAFRELAEKHPGHTLAPLARFAAAQTLSSAALPDQALVQWQTYLRDFPKADGVPEALYQEALDLIRLNRKTEALPVLEDLLKRFPASPRRANAAYWKGSLLLDAKDFKPAAEAFRTALATDPPSALADDVRLGLASALRALGEEDEAATLLQQALASADAARVPPAQFAWLAALQVRKGQFDAAAKTARALLDIAANDEDRQTGWTLLGRAEHAASRARTAEEAFAKACALPVETAYAPEASLRLGELLLARGDAAGADARFRAAIAQCGEDRMDFRLYAYVGVGHAALAKGDEEEAVKYLMTACSLFYNKEVLPPVFRETIRLLSSLGREEEAAVFRAMLEKDYGAAE